MEIWSKEYFLEKDYYYAMVGLCVGDALGVPYEFIPRSSMDNHPATDMVGYCSHNKPLGTWSDDTSMMLALADSLAKGRIDYDDVMNNFAKWLFDGGYTVNGDTFGVGRITQKAIYRFYKGTPPLECGGTGIKDNGNGSLMRILPAAFFFASECGVIVNKDVVETIHNLSALTHAHNISKMACVFYCNIAFHLLKKGTFYREQEEIWLNAEERRSFLCQTVTHAIQDVGEYYNNISEYAKDMYIFKRLLDENFPYSEREDINSTGYVVDTLEAAVWCLLNNDDYSNTALAAVNLGGDTDTTAAVAGGLAGLFYQDNAEIGIPKRWIDEIVNLDLVKEICDTFSKSLINC